MFETDSLCIVSFLYGLTVLQSIFMETSPWTFSWFNFFFELESVDVHLWWLSKVNEASGFLERRAWNTDIALPLCKRKCGCFCFVLILRRTLLRKE